MAKDKFDFIAELLESKKLNQTQKERFLMLASQEMKREGMQGKIFEERIAKLEDLILSNSENLNKSSISENGRKTEGKGGIVDTDELNESKKLHPHKPTHTIMFLKNFKHDNDTGLKELVHKPTIDKDFDLKYVIDKVKRHPNLKSIFFDNYDKKSTPKNWISSSVRKGTEGLIKYIEKEGIPYNQRTGKHPMEHSEIATEIQRFKQNYRFSSEKSESSILTELINNILGKLYFADKENNTYYAFNAKDTSGQFGIDQVKIQPDIETFILFASFFTWVENIKNVLWWIFEGILKHSNINGNRYFTVDEKSITISIERVRDEIAGVTKIHLKIRDEKSFLLKSPDQFLNDIKGTDHYKWRLRGLADWQIHCYQKKEGGLVFNILSDKEPSWTVNENIKEYFEHIITFYD